MAFIKKGGFKIISTKFFMRSKWCANLASWCGGPDDSYAEDFDNDLPGQDKFNLGDVEIVRACADIVEHEQGCDYEEGLAACSCTNTQAYAGVDGGCGVFTNKPICVSDEGREISACVGGSFCALCVNTQQADWVADQGCPPDKPMCVCGDTTPDLWFAGTQCVEFNVFCVNTAAHGGFDEKCDYDHPICVGPNGKPIDSHCYGDACVTCVNSQQSDGVADYGCTSDKPRYLKTDGNAPTLTYPGDVCSAPVHVDTSPVNMHRIHLIHCAIIVEVRNLVVKTIHPPGDSVSP
jgi:hypothetical protein